MANTRRQRRVRLEREIKSRLAELNDRGSESPYRLATPVALCVAQGVARGFARHPEKELLRIAATGDGGVVFESRCGETFETLEVCEDGCVEIYCYRLGKLVSRAKGKGKRCTERNND